MKEQEVEPPVSYVELPEFVTWLMEIGPTEAAGMGQGPIRWTEINAWCDGTGPNLEPWQRRLLRRLSQAYVTETRRAEDPMAPAPDVTTVDREGVGKAMRDAMADWKRRA